MRRTTLVLMVCLLAPGAARASVFGEENATLAQIAAGVVAQIKQAADYMNQFKDYYKSFKEYAGYAKDAVDAFEAAKSFNINNVSAEALLDEAFPDASRIRRDIQSGNWWQADGGLRRMVRLCVTQTLNGQSRTNCSQVESTISAEEVRSNLDQTFGETHTFAGRALADSSAVAITEGTSQRGQNDHIRKTTVKEAKLACEQSKDPAGCQAAANLAQIESLNQLTLISDQLARANDLKALELRERAAQLEAERRDVEFQNAMIRGAMNLEKPLDLEAR